MVLWIFGYSSLLWKVGFGYDERIVGFVKGYRRAFHVACFEHRGTYELPARVPTLEKDPDAVCWGVALCIKDPDATQQVLSYLKIRESEYDLVGTVDFFTESSPDVPYVSQALVFMSTATSKYYLGPASLKDMANQIARATGPSGPNCDYLFRLVEALRDIGHEDMEVTQLANTVKKKLCELQAQPTIRVATRALSSKSLLQHPSGNQSPRHLSTGFSIGCLGSLSGYSPCSPRLIKSQAL